MAQLYFHYGTMNSGKSFEILKVAHNYEEQGKGVLVLTSGVDDRISVGVVASRVGEQRKAIPIMEDTDVYDLIRSARSERAIYCILIDEAQFLKRDQVQQLAKIVDDYNIPVMAFGLKNDFQNHLFEGSAELLALAEKIEEVKTICWFCGKKAIMNLRVHDQKPVYEGEQIQIGGNESYYPVCRKHYFTPPMKAEGKIQLKEER